MLGFKKSIHGDIKVWTWGRIPPAQSEASPPPAVWTWRRPAAGVSPPLCDLEDIYGNVRQRQRKWSTKKMCHANVKGIRIHLKLFNIETCFYVTEIVLNESSLITKSLIIMLQSPSSLYKKHWCCCFDNGSCIIHKFASDTLTVGK